MPKGVGKGNTNNPNGRPKGVPNKSTQLIKDSFQLFVDGNVKNFEKWLKEVAKTNPAKAIELVQGTAEYILPKLSRTEFKGEVTTNDEDMSKYSDEDIDKMLEIKNKYK